MFSHDVRFEGFTASDWNRLISLFTPKSISNSSEVEGVNGGLVVILREGKVLKFVHTQIGRISPKEISSIWPVLPEELATRFKAKWCLFIEAGSLEQIMDRFAQRSNPEDDMTQQAICLLEEFRTAIQSKKIQFWPRNLENIPLPKPSMISLLLDSICPIGKVACLGIFSQGELWTSLTIRRGAKGIDTILGPDVFRKDLGLISGDWRRDHRFLSKVVESRLGPISVGCYAEYSTFAHLQSKYEPGSWARAVAIRDVVLHPFPVGFAVPIGLDASRAIVNYAQKWIQRFEMEEWIKPIVDTASEWLPSSDQANPLKPLEALRKWWLGK